MRTEAESLFGKRSLVQLASTTGLVLPAGSAFSHLTAARLLGLPVPGRWAPPEPQDVMTFTAAPKIRRAGCEGHRGLGSRHVIQRNGLRVVSPQDTWCDLAAMAAGSLNLDLDDLIVLGDAVVHHRRGISPSRLAETVSWRRGGRGRRLMVEALPHLRPRSNSPMETRARLLFLRGGLPEPELNVVINDQHSGQWLSDSDFVWRPQKVVAEFDGDHHRLLRPHGRGVGLGGWGVGVRGWGWAVWRVSVGWSRLLRLLALPGRPLGRRRRLRRLWGRPPGPGGRR